MNIVPLHSVSHNITDTIRLSLSVRVICFTVFTALTVHNGGSLLVRAEQTTHDDDVMLIAPAPVRPQDVAELNRQLQQVEGDREIRSNDDNNRPALFTDYSDDSNSESVSPKRAVSMLRMGKRRVSMLRMGRAFDDGEKRAVGMLRMGRQFDNGEPSEKKAVSMLRMGRSGSADENEEKRAVSMLRMGRNVEPEHKRAVSMLRMGRSEGAKRAVHMLRICLLYTSDAADE